MGFDTDFLRDEVRCGFYIPTAIKQAWAAALEVLSEIDRICEKHDITYFADWGTLLGAVRHGGFVPWDDDLDIGMKRSDYEKFRSVADAELPDNYVFHDYERKNDHWEFIVRVVNNEKMCFDERYLREHNNFPWLVGTDIFVKDYLYPSDDMEKERDKEVMKLYTVAQMVIGGKADNRVISAQLYEINKKYGTSLSAAENSTELAVKLYRLAEQQMSRVKDNESRKIGQIFPWVVKNGTSIGEDKELYEKIIRIPFENTTIPVPVSYGKILTKRYGDFNQIRKVWTGHGYPFFEGQKKEMEELSGEKLPDFCFRREMLSRPAVDLSASLKNTVRECVNALRELLVNAEDAVCGRVYDDASKALIEAQQLTIDLGTLLENVKGENAPHTKKVVKALEELCEFIWQDHLNLSENGSDKRISSRDVLGEAENIIEANIINRREILFLPVGHTEWEGFSAIYYEALNESDTDVYVVPLPVLRKDYFGNIIMSEEEINVAAELEKYPKDVSLTDWRTYDLSIHCPDVVYIQNPYDETNPCLTVPAEFYAENIRKYTGEMIFIPFKKTDEFGCDDINDIYNMKHYVKAPGIVYADRVLVQSENIREQYIRCLTGFAGEDTKKCWEDKIKVGTAESSNMPIQREEKKKMLYCIGINELMEHREKLIDAVNDRIRLFLENKERINSTVYLYPNDIDEWREIDEDLSDKLLSIIKKAKLEMIAVMIKDAEMETRKYDAYYGSPSPMVSAFVSMHKPIMISNYDVMGM